MKGMSISPWTTHWPGAHVTGNRAQVFIADRDSQGANAFAAELNTGRQVVWTAQVDVTDWEQQASAFQTAIDQFGRIDYVFPVAGLAERRAFPNRGKNHKGFEKADLTVIDVNLTAVIHTVSLALQQFRRQEVNKFGFRGKSTSGHSILAIGI
jgi:NAD(P)-dependent dehydrogenase (short-subunit alcohol dehydrogenase family)